MDGAVQAGERAAYEVASTIAQIAASHGATSRAVIPPERPGPEPENVKVSSREVLFDATCSLCLFFRFVCSFVLFECLFVFTINGQVPHPKVVSPSFVERYIVPSVGTTVTVALLTAAVFAFRFVARR